MGWKIFDAFIFSVGVVIAILVFFHESVYNLGFSDAFISFLKSIDFGIIIFILFIISSAILYKLFHWNFKGEKKEKEEYENQRKRRNRKIHVMGIVIMLVSIGVFLNSFLYIKALAGNDMLVSLKLDNENLVLKNGEVGEVSVKAKVLTNPFCQANCSLILEDLSKDLLLDYENTYLQVSSPLSKNYLLSVDEGTTGQNLYRVRLECNTTKTTLCYVASENTKSRTKIISIDHELNDVQKIRQQDLKLRIERINNGVYSIQKDLSNKNYNYYYLDLSTLKYESNQLNNISNNLSNLINNTNYFYSEQRYYETEESLSYIEEDFNNLSERYSALNFTYYDTMYKYNLLVSNLEDMYNESVYLMDYNFSNSSLLVAESFVNNFNLMVLEMSKYSPIDNKTALFDNLSLERDNLFLFLYNESITDIPKENKLNVSLNYPNLPTINYNHKVELLNFTLDEPLPICCFKGSCFKCLDDSTTNYPIILVHGHSFNEKISAELSMESFSEMSSVLDQEGYVYAGDLYNSQIKEGSKGYLGRMNKTMIFRTTYYIDIFDSEEGSFVLESKGDNISVYADRLNEVVSNVKYITGKDKVIIVAHSMGGLVTRKYIQMYGEDSLDRVVLVAVPNHGVDGRVISSCPIFGADAECADLASDSLFIEDLNSYSILSVPVYNIVAEGCFWEGSNGDGIVKNYSAYLEGSNNIYVNGTCNGINFFHVNVIKPSKYFEVYEIIKRLISE